MKRDMAADVREAIARYAAELAAAAPELTPEQRDRLALLLRPVKRAEQAAA